MLKVISSSPGELEPVFNAMLAECNPNLRGHFGNLSARRKCLSRRGAPQRKPTSICGAIRCSIYATIRGTPIDRVAKTKQVVHIHDLRTDSLTSGKTIASCASSKMPAPEP